MQEKGKEAVSPVIDLMDHYFLTKDDWDAIMELGIGPMNMENLSIDSQAKATFTRLYNSKSHPLPFMKASQIVAPTKSQKERPDLEEALEASDSGASDAEGPAVPANEDLDLKKDKYVKAAKPKTAKAGAASKRSAAAESKPKATSEGASKAKPKPARKPARK